MKSMQGTDIRAKASAKWDLEITTGGGARYLQIVDFIERAIGEGRLVAGDRVPPQRSLAKSLRVDLTTVTRAYNEAKRRHLIDARGALGTFIAAPRAELARVIDMSMNVPPPPAGLDFQDLLRRGLSQVLLHSDPHLLMTYQLGGGSAADRSAGTLWLAQIFGQVATARLVVCPGAQAALAAVILARTRPGDAIVSEPLAYPGIRAAAAQLGRRVIIAPVDADGMLPDALEAARADGATLAYLNPTAQNPTTHTMPASRREAIARAAAHCDVTLLEDDPYWLLTPSAPPPLSSFAPERTYYVSTLSKTLSPGLRTAYVMLPEGRRGDDLLASLRAFALMAAPMTAALATQWIHDGSAMHLLDGIRTEALARCALASRWLSGIGQLPPSAIHAWHRLPEHWSAQQLTRAALAEDLRVTPSDAFWEGPNAPTAIRISLGGVEDRAQLSAALRRLAALLERRPTPGLEMVV
ncbi:GntR family transcriptional regulator [Cupriavidus necator]|uniref:aminotransferase-like domain-containing protein n=1 Tax=Cupriavidus necator TaxID=106590 RepID=UPI000735839E|nr:GntR family transcriptional regulator [Cupriavidus necator]